MLEIAELTLRNLLINAGMIGLFIGTLGGLFLFAFIQENKYIKMKIHLRNLTDSRHYDTVELLTEIEKKSMKLAEMTNTEFAKNLYNNLLKIKQYYKRKRY